MGEPNAFHAVLKDVTHYYVNLGAADFTREEFFKTFECFCGNVTNLDSEWRNFYMGFGNYLVVRKRYYEIIMNYIYNNLPEDFEYGPLYQKWYEIITKVVK